MSYWACSSFPDIPSCRSRQRIIWLEYILHPELFSFPWQSHMSFKTNDFFIPSSGCEASMTVGELIRGNNVAVGKNLNSEGYLDCARLCTEEASCKAWTLDVTSNKCWLKTSSERRQSNKNWVWGLPCWEKFGDLWPAWEKQHFFLILPKLYLISNLSKYHKSF